MTYTKICPKCGSTEVTISGRLYGTTDYCKKCGFSGLFPEVEDVKEFRKQLKK